MDVRYSTDRRRVLVRVLSAGRRLHAPLSLSTANQTTTTGPAANQWPLVEGDVFAKGSHLISYTQANQSLIQRGQCGSAWRTLRLGRPLPLSSLARTTTDDDSPPPFGFRCCGGLVPSSRPWPFPPVPFHLTPPRHIKLQGTTESTRQASARRAIDAPGSAILR